jgi:hypothetical protein
MQTKSHLARPSIAAESSFSAEEPMPDHLYHVIFLLGTLRPDSFLGFPELYNEALNYIMVFCTLVNVLCFAVSLEDLYRWRGNLCTLRGPFFTFETSSPGNLHYRSLATFFRAAENTHKTMYQCLKSLYNVSLICFGKQINPAQLKQADSGPSLLSLVNGLTLLGFLRRFGLSKEGFISLLYGWGALKSRKGIRCTSGEEYLMRFVVSQAGQSLLIEIPLGGFTDEVADSGKFASDLPGPLNGVILKAGLGTLISLKMFDRANLGTPSACLSEGDATKMNAAWLRRYTQRVQHAIDEVSHFLLVNSAI